MAEETVEKGNRKTTSKERLMSRAAQARRTVSRTRCPADGSSGDVAVARALVMNLKFFFLMNSLSIWMPKLREREPL